MAHILVVDDESVIREILVTLLEMQGHEVTEAGSGAEALAIFDESTHDLIISDIMMPEMNGFDLLRALQPRLGEKIAFIVLSSHDDPDGIEAAIYAGAFDYLLKPFETERVRVVVERALARAA